MKTHVSQPFDGLSRKHTTSDDGREVLGTVYEYTSSLAVPTGTITVRRTVWLASVAFLGGVLFGTAVRLA